MVISPFLKWPGGKRWFIQSNFELIPKSFNTYFEPFLGSGAMFFYLKPSKAVLSDLNPDLIETFKGIKLNPKKVLRLLNEHQLKHSDSYYYEVRKSTAIDSVTRAARMIYLNRTCFNGIYRVNQAGFFNVPKGSKENVLYETDNFQEVSKTLKNATLRQWDFERVIARAKKNDFIFADPPYTVRHNTNGFIKYNEKLFSWEDQERLSKCVIGAKNRGVKIILTNANHSSIRKLYRGAGFRFISVSRFSSIAANGNARKKFDELIITSE